MSCLLFSAVGEKAKNIRRIKTVNLPMNRKCKTTASWEKCNKHYRGI